jgi:hypothetical protein
VTPDQPSGAPASTQQLFLRKLAAILVEIARAHAKKEPDKHADGQ